MGFSKRHASSIGLIRNLRTGSISPQCHVVYDNCFSTLPVGQRENRDDPVPPNWEELLKFDRHKINFEDSDRPVELSEEWLDDADMAKQQKFRQLRQREQRYLRVPPIGPEFLPVAADNDDDEGEIPVVETVDDDDESVDGDTDVAPDSPPPLRSERIARGTRRNPRFYDDDWVNAFTVRHRQRQIEEYEKECGVISSEEAFLCVARIV